MYFCYCCLYNLLLKPCSQKCSKERNYNNVLFLSVLVYFLWSLMFLCSYRINKILNLGFYILHDILSSSLAAIKSLSPSYFKNKNVTFLSCEFHSACSLQNTENIKKLKEENKIIDNSSLPDATIDTDPLFVEMCLSHKTLVFF